MNNVLQMLIGMFLKGGGLGQLARQFGISEEKLSQIISSGIPIIIAGLAKNANKPGGAGNLGDALRKDHDGSIFDNFPDLAQHPQGQKGGGILDHIFGGSKANQPSGSGNVSAIEDALARGIGVPPAVVKQVMEYLAPVVMGGVGKQQDTEAMNDDRLTEVLTEASKQIGEEEGQNYDNLTDFMKELEQSEWSGGSTETTSSQAQRPSGGTGMPGSLAEIGMEIFKQLMR